MVTASAALEAFLESGVPFWGAELYTITLVGGTVLRLTSLDQDIYYPTVGGHTYTSKGPYVNRSKLSLGVGLKSSKLDLTLIANPTVQVNGIPILQAIAQGAFTGASVNVRRAFMTQGDIQHSPVICNLTGAATGTGDGTICRFGGWVGKVTEVTPLSAMLELRDAMYYFNRPAPKNCFQPGCWHTLFDQGCTLHPTDTSPVAGIGTYIQTGAVQSGSTTVTIKTLLTQDSANTAAPTVGPTLAQHTVGSGGSTAFWIGYYVTYTWVTVFGETTASPEASLGIPGSTSHQYVCAVTVPSIPAGALGWNMYVGDGSGAEQLQNTAGPLTGTTEYTQLGGPLLSGILPPGIPTTGYWALGQITFTSGALNGQSFSVDSSDASGDIILTIPASVAPSAGDTFSIIPGCDKTYPTCQNKYNNLVHFTGCPAIPTPELGG